MQDDKLRATAIVAFFLPMRLMRARPGSSDFLGFADRLSSTLAASCDSRGAISRSPAGAPGRAAVAKYPHLGQQLVHLQGLVAGFNIDAANSLSE